MSKKATKATKEFRQYETGDPVLGKIRGYPPWPGVVVDPASAPPAVQNDHPPGKKATFHCVLFFPTGDYAWLHAKDMSSLKAHEIEAFLADETKKRNGELREGYRIARDPKSWMLQRLAAAQAQQDAEAEEKENEQVDELESERGAGEDAAAAATAGEDAAAAGTGTGAAAKKGKAGASTGATGTKKRKRESEAAEATSAAPKTAKKAPKAKKDSAEPAPKKAASAAGKSASAGGKSRKNGARSKNHVESEDDAEGAEVEEADDAEGGAGAGGSSKKVSPPPAKKAKRDKDDDGDDNKTGDPLSMKVRDWRHKLQKTFLSAKTLPKPESMAEIDQLFTTVETYDKMTIEQLQFSKIGKVMRHIAALTDDKMPPRDAEYHFRARAKGLVDKWHAILNANRPVPGIVGPAGVYVPATATGADAGAGATTNGNGNGRAAKEQDAEGEQEDAEMGDAEAEGEPEPEAEAEADADAEVEEGVDAEVGGKKGVEGGEDAVTLGTRSLDLNGKGGTATTESPAAPAAGTGTGVVAEDEQDAPADADADLSMSVEI